ncbi:DUF3817 domain-containing protein [Pseudokineococcus marinus]|uniref:DUF3817 domain-containing protein n=1 Tax=Pseudokineococcus marinus TaxID=351215 RepID=A0A849BVY9_9ACTN|nr:DUF3817 domain-containing protein [Pseudokineococcus marinus]NNH23656.1 DUF3817 domain-containing protein [Pseudokineococcus marinus]
MSTGRPTPPAPTGARARRLREASLGPALTRYRVMAIVTGVFLLVVTVQLVVREVFGPEILGSWVAIAHGWIYIVYLVTVVDMWSRLRWGPARLAGLVLAGVVPFVSFVVEHRVTQEVRALLRQLAQQRDGA